MIRFGDDPAQAEKFEAMRNSSCDRRAADTYANPVRGARNYGGAHAAVQRLRLLLLGTAKVEGEDCMKRTAELQRKTPMKRVGFLRSSARENKAVAKLQNGMKSRGMKGRAPTADEKRFMDAIGSIGCIACRKDGIENPWISIHHIDGRTKPGAHFETLPLCAPHHQPDDSDPMRRLSLHGHKKQFTHRYGTEMELLVECVGLVRNQLVNPDGSEIELPVAIKEALVSEKEAA